MLLGATVSDHCERATTHLILWQPSAFEPRGGAEGPENRRPVRFNAAALVRALAACCVVPDPPAAAAGARNGSASDNGRGNGNGARSSGTMPPPPARRPLASSGAAAAAVALAPARAPCLRELQRVRRRLAGGRLQLVTAQWLIDMAEDVEAGVPLAAAGRSEGEYVPTVAMPARGSTGGGGGGSGNVEAEEQPWGSDARQWPWAAVGLGPLADGPEGGSSASDTDGGEQKAGASDGDGDGAAAEGTCRKMAAAKPKARSKAASMAGSRRRGVATDEAAEEAEPEARVAAPVKRRTSRGGRAAAATGATAPPRPRHGRAAAASAVGEPASDQDGAVVKEEPPLAAGTPPRQQRAPRGPKPAGARRRRGTRVFCEDSSGSCAHDSGGGILRLWDGEGEGEGDGVWVGPTSGGALRHPKAATKKAKIGKKRERGADDFISLLAGEDKGEDKGKDKGGALGGSGARACEIAGAGASDAPVEGPSSALKRRRKEAIAAPEERLAHLLGAGTIGGGAGISRTSRPAAGAAIAEPLPPPRSEPSGPAASSRPMSLMARLEAQRAAKQETLPWEVDRPGPGPGAAAVSKAPPPRSPTASQVAEAAATPLPLDYTEQQAPASVSLPRPAPATSAPVPPPAPAASAPGPSSVAAPAPAAAGTASAPAGEEGAPAPPPRKRVRLADLAKKHGI
jgi:hypothetical protein